jgi:hypothetical protein
MKSLVLSAVISFTLLYCTSNAQSPEKKTMELVMEVPKADPVKSLKILKKRLNALPDVKVEGFCDTRKLLMLRLNPEEYFNVLVAVDEAGYNYYIKKELHISEVMSTCESGSLYTKESSSLE